MKIDSYNAYEFCFDVIGDAFSCYHLTLFYKQKEIVPVTKININTILQCAAYHYLSKQFKQIIQ